MVFVVLALLGQIAVGIAIVRSDALPDLLGWVTILWNIVWLMILTLTNPAEVYFPILHHAMPLTIGSVLIVGGRDEPDAT